jgi:hypothetical protein
MAKFHLRRCLCHLRKRPELHQQAQPVNAVPVLDDLPIGHPHDVNDVNFDLASGWCDALKRSQMVPLKTLRVNAPA